ncbi:MULTISPECIES: G5 domain-containing protein [Coprobacillaceae]|uniref:G5 domain-containing protein n=1 Tax=Coprobacillaceae TaxID=2810280 RepID=UPI000E4DDEE9|nr:MULTISPECIES: G5 domain-containing protein [Coprobacillaceae]RHM61292.1 hypothetical protein DWZ53_05155 [Coprobacillus sp. AF33-1AC]RHS95873.1 hypothetical protein DW911_02380 [Erysipelatoclostridium sp. AM42-17]
MNKIKQAVIKADPRLKGLLVVMIAYIGIMTTMLVSGATSQIDHYQETVAIEVQDGSDEQKDYLVRQNTVRKVLNELNIHLNQNDTVNKDFNYIVQNKDYLKINRVSKENIDEVVTTPSSTINTTGLHLFTTEVRQQGSNGQVKNTYQVTYQNGQIVSKQLVSSTVVSPVSDTIIETGVVQPGAYFTGKLTTYGGDCAGGSGIGASGVSLSPTTGVQGSNTAKLRFNGQSYYCLAADPSIPFGTIIEIRNHNLSIEPVAYGIVVDRGGAIKKNHIDIFNGTEAGKYFKGGSSNQTEFKIISVGSGKNFWK